MPTSRRRGTKRRSRQEIGRLVEEFKRSALERTAFAESIGVHVNTLYKWLRQRPMEKASAAQVAVPVRLRAQGPSAAPVLEVALANGRTIRVHGEFDRKTLLDLVDALETSC